MVQQLTPPGLENNALVHRSYRKVSPDLKKLEPLSQLLPDFDPLSDLEKVIANDVIKPLVFILNHAVPFSDKIHYDQLTRRFTLIKTSWRWKVACALWTVIILWRLIVKASPGSSESSNGVLAWFVKVSYIFFLVYCSVFFHQLWRNGQTFTSIFNECIDSASDLFLKFHCAPRTRLVFLVTHSSWIFCLTFSFTSHVMGGIVAIMNEVTGNKSSLSSVMFGYENMTDSRFSLNELSPEYPIIVHALVVVANFLNTFNWMLSFLYIGIWALLFRQLFSIFFWKIETINRCGYELDLPREIRTFNKIATLVDKYNAFSGLHVLWGAVVCILYISTSIEQAITDVKNITQFSLKIHLFLSYMPIMTAALMISEVHRKASMFSDVIKNCYNQCKGIKNSGTMETLFGVAIVHHDIGMSNIGFKGLGFFTVSYQFIVAMLSVTITYALVAIQWFPQLNTTPRQHIIGKE